MVAEIAQLESAALPLKWTERQVQDAVYIHCAIKNHELIVPNSCLLGWESDVISVNRTGFIAEFEIKVTRSDFRADAKKAHRHLLIDPVQKSAWTDRTFTHPRPNYFYYVVPTGLVTPDEVPDYAGLIYAEKRVEDCALFYGMTQEIKPAKRLHKDKISDSQRHQLCRALTGRYWRQRLKLLSAPCPSEQVE